MIYLDENILGDQRDLLDKWNIPCKQIGSNLGRMGMQDDEIIPFLLTLPRPTFFTMDQGFYRRRPCHPRYAIIYLNVEEEEVAAYIRRFLRHPEFNTQAKRLGKVIRVTSASLSIWRLHAETEVTIMWR